MTYTEPLLALLLAVSILGFLQFARYKRRSVLLIGLLGIFVITWSPFDWIFSRPLEAWYPLRVPQPRPDVKAIVVLSSTVDPPVRERPYPLADDQTYQRCRFAAWLYTHWHAAPVLASGGGNKENPFAATMRQILEQNGVPDAMIWTEEYSYTTHENALYSSQILHARGVSTIALVVDASSMVRAAACFRKAGIEVIPALSEFCELGSPPNELLPNWKALRQNEITLHETLALGWYRLRGWI